MNRSCPADHLPRSHVIVGRAVVPTYLACGLCGVSTGSMAMIGLAMLAGRSVAVVVGLAGVVAAAFIVSGLLARRLLGREQYVLLREFYAALAVAAVALAVAAVPVLPYLDLLTVALCLVFGWGRLGCTVVGCCYGAPGLHGLLYPRSEPAGAHGVRRFPVQPVEALAWFVFAALAAAFVLSGPPGLALAATLMLYGVLRWCLEGLRADPRGRWLGLSEGRWLSLVGVGVGLALYGRSAALVTNELVLGGVGVSAAIALTLTRARWLDLPPALPADLPERARVTGEAIAAARLGVEVRSWFIDDILVGASVHSSINRTEVMLSLSRRGSMLMRCEAEYICVCLAVAFEKRGHPTELYEHQPGLFITSLMLPDARTSRAHPLAHDTHDLDYFRSQNEDAMKGRPEK